MRKFYILFVTCFFYLTLWSQAINDDCQTASEIGLMDGTYNFLSSDFNLFDTCIDISTLQASTSYPFIYTTSLCHAIPNSVVGKDVWLKFISTPAFTIRGTKSQNALSPIDSVSITFWKGGDCGNLQPVGNYSYIINPANPILYDTIWTGNTTTTDTFYAQIRGITLTSIVQLYLCFRGLNGVVPPIAGCYFANALSDTICFEYSKEVIAASWTTAGYAFINVQNGASPFTYSWNDGVSTAERTNLSVGTHYVTITDNGGCTVTDSISIVNDCRITLNVQKTGPSFYQFTASSADTISTKHFLWRVNNDTIVQTGITGSINYLFNANGNATVCVQASDTMSQCIFDTCMQIAITNGVYIPLLEEINIWHYATNMGATMPAPVENHSRSLSCNLNYNSSAGSLELQVQTRCYKAGYIKFYGGKNSIRLFQNLHV